MTNTEDSSWPPRDGRQFVRSEEFGELLIEEAQRLAKAYPELELVDAVATVFAWFARKLNRNAHFINRRRFPTVAKFRAYLRQALFNGARLARRTRSRGKPLSEIPPEEQITEAPKLSPADCETLHQMVEGLTEPLKSVFTRVFFDETDMSIVAGSLDMDEETASEIYEEAVDALQSRGNR